MNCIKNKLFWRIACQYTGELDNNTFNRVLSNLNIKLEPILYGKIERVLRKQLEDECYDLE